MSDRFLWFVGFDWASEQHRVCLLDAEGEHIAERDVRHGGGALSELCGWLLSATGAQPAQIAVGIETPRGPVVETLLERGFAVFAINPKQLDRFRDRFTVAGAKDDSRDAQVLGHSLRTDEFAFRRLSTDDPLVIELREWSRIHEELTQERIRLANRVRDQLDALSNQFKQISALLIPLSKAGVLLNQYRRNLDNWREAVRSQYREALKTLGVRLAVLAALLTIVFAAAEAWRRAVVRYIQDSRRRYQFLLLRRITLWCLVVVIVGFAFASELGSIVTFAGLITAGLAVAMQSVLVSIVGYFFLIGKYGIRVGDRVQIGEVTGEVIDLGLVRLHLMELGGHGTLGPTGRVVAFANSIVFQVSSGLFKQIHGVNFVWREITVSLPPGIDYAAAKRKLTAAVTNVLMEDREEILRQTNEIQRATSSSSGGDVQPRVQLSFSATGVDAHIRYPVHLQNAGEMEERVSQAVFSVGAAVSTDSKTVRSI